MSVSVWEHMMVHRQEYPQADGANEEIIDVPNNRRRSYLNNVGTDESKYSDEDTYAGGNNSVEWFP